MPTRSELPGPVTGLPHMRVVVCEERLHHVPVCWLFGDRVGKKVSNVLHHGDQAITSWAWRDLVANDDRHTAVAELANRG
jgi:hypothetical protein